MPATVKYEQVDELKGRLARTQAIFACEYRGMTVAQITALRSQVRAAGGEMKVAKNTLMRIAMKQEGFIPFPDDMAFGPNVFALAYGDPVAVAKALRDFSKERTNKFFVMKGCVLGKPFLMPRRLALSLISRRRRSLSVRLSAPSRPRLRVCLRFFPVLQEDWSHASTRSRNRRKTSHSFFTGNTSHMQYAIHEMRYIQGGKKNDPR